jgi:transcriptional regulator with XRE-family HTH domain
MCRTGLACGQYAKTRGISISHISRKTDITVDKLSKSFRGIRNLSADEFADVCKAMEASPDYIMANANTP